ncbi:MAG: dihydropteroate synthase [Planctomycetota bacterium]
MSFSWKRRDCGVMGILNVTPDSFSDGGEHEEVERAVSRALEMESQGAQLIDIGAESTRPGSLSVPPDRQWERLEPVLRRLSGRLKVPLSVDTTWSSVAERAAGLGVVAVNDTSAGTDDPQMFRMAAKLGLAMVLMHRKALPEVMQSVATYEDVVREVGLHLVGRAREGLKAGLTMESICLDPGIGFGKTLEQNLALLREIPRLAATGHAVLVGLSRKSFLGTLTGETEPRRRDGASVAGALAASRRGAQWVRVHAVDLTQQALAVDKAVEAS